MSQTDKVRNAIGTTPAPGRQANSSSQYSRPSDEISFTLRSLERWVGWSVAAYTAFTIVLLYRGFAGLWIFVAYAGLVGYWGQIFPAWRQVHLLARAVALLAGALLLHVYLGSEIGAMPEPFFFWFVIPTLCYAFMLTMAGAWFVVVLSVTGYVLAWWQVHTHSSWLEMLAQTGMLFLIPPLLCMRFGRAMRSAQEVAEEGLRDRVTGLYNKSGLMHHGQRMVDTFDGEAGAVCMVLVTAGTAQQIRDAPARRAARKAVTVLATRMARIAGKRGLAARTGALEFAIMLPGTRDKAMRIVEGVLSPLTGTEINGIDGALALTPTWCGRVVDPKVQSLQELFDELRGPEPAQGHGLEHGTSLLHSTLAA